MKSIRRIQKTLIRRIQEKEYNILEDIKRGPYSKKKPKQPYQLLGYAEKFIRPSRLKKVMADKKVESSVEKFVLYDKTDYYSGIESIIVNGKNAYELKGKFLDDLHNNAFSGTNEKDAVEHVEYYLKIVDPIRLPNVNQDKLRIVKMGSDEIDVSDDETSDIDDEIAKVFRIDTDIFNYETPICSAFNEFNYLLKVDPDLLTKDIEGFKTFDDYKNDWIYEWNKDDYEWYEALEDSELKDLALRNKASMEGLISDDDNESCYKQRLRWDVYTNYDDAYEINHEEEESCEES
ncbi:hypothetical protein Tco_0550136 [Tanacetum coccineum]